jgi:hypothetical protein
MSDVDLLEEDTGPGAGSSVWDMSDEELLEEEGSAEPKADTPAPAVVGGTTDAILGSDGQSLGTFVGIWRPDTPGFYLSLCLDVLVIAMLVRTARCWFAQKAQIDENGDKIISAPCDGAAESPAQGPSLLEAVRNGDAERCRALLETADQAAAQRLVKETDLWGCTPLHLAAHLGSTDSAKLLLAAGGEVDAKEAWEQTPLHFAARADNIEMCELLLAKGALINAVDSSDHTPLLVAAHANRASACELLLSHGASTGGIPEGELPAMLSMLLLQRMVEPADESAADGVDLSD